MRSSLTTLSILALASAHLAYSRPTPSNPATSSEFDDVLSLSPLELVPAYVDKRDVPDYTAPKGLKLSIAYFPAIEQPAEGSVFNAGGELVVAWNNTVPNYAPEQIHNYATLLLGFRNPDDPASGLNLDVSRPLANVSLYGSQDPISVQLPSDLTTRSTYLLVLGSTANMSPLFTINGIDSEQSSSSTEALATKTGVASSPSSSTSPTQEPTSTVIAAPASSSSSSRAGAARVATPSQESSSAGSQSPSPDAASVAVSPSPVTSSSPSSGPSSSFSASAQTSSSSPTQKVATPISASGGALAASSAPTSAASALFSFSSTLPLFVVGVATLVIIT